MRDLGRTAASRVARRRFVTRTLADRPVRATKGRWWGDAPGSALRSACIVAAGLPWFGTAVAIRRRRLYRRRRDVWALRPSAVHVRLICHRGRCPVLDPGTRGELPHRGGSDQNLATMIRAIMGDEIIAMVVIDTLVERRPCADENSAQEVGVVIAGW